MLARHVDFYSQLCDSRLWQPINGELIGSQVIDGDPK